MGRLPSPRLTVRGLEATRGRQQTIGEPHACVGVVEYQPPDGGGIVPRYLFEYYGDRREPSVVRPLAHPDPKEARELRLVLPERLTNADQCLPIPPVHGDEEFEIAAERVVVADREEEGHVRVQGVALLTLAVQSVLEPLARIDQPADRRAGSDDAGVRVGQGAGVRLHRHGPQADVDTVAD